MSDKSLAYLGCAIEVLTVCAFPLLTVIGVVLPIWVYALGVGVGLILLGLAYKNWKVVNQTADVQHHVGRNELIPYDQLNSSSQRQRQLDYIDAIRSMRAIHTHVDYNGLDEAKRTGASFNADTCWQCGGQRFQPSPLVNYRGLFEIGRMQEQETDDSDDADTNTPKDN